MELVPPLGPAWHHHTSVLGHFLPPWDTDTHRGFLKKCVSQSCAIHIWSNELGGGGGGESKAQGLVPSYELLWSTSSPALVSHSGRTIKQVGNMPRKDPFIYIRGGGGDGRVDNIFLCTLYSCFSVFVGQTIGNPKLIA